MSNIPPIQNQAIQNAEQINNTANVESNNQGREVNPDHRPLVNTEQPRAESIFPKIARIIIGVLTLGISELVHSIYKCIHVRHENGIQARVRNANNTDENVLQEIAQLGNTIDSIMGVNNKKNIEQNLLAETSQDEKQTQNKTPVSNIEFL